MAVHQPINFLNMCDIYIYLFFFCGFLDKREYRVYIYLLFIKKILNKRKEIQKN